MTLQIEIVRLLRNKLDMAQVFLNEHSSHYVAFYFTSHVDIYRPRSLFGRPIVTCSELEYEKIYVHEAEEL